MKKLLVPAILILAVVFTAGCTSTGQITNEATHDAAQGDTAAQEQGQGLGGTTLPDDTGAKVFHTDSFFTMSGGKPNPQFSLKEITVNKGDRVVVYVNAINGTHDFKIDEFNVKSETPTGQTTRIEFVASETGTFVYYCNKPGHRANGHLGTLTVNE